MIRLTGRYWSQNKYSIIKRLFSLLGKCQMIIIIWSPCLFCTPFLINQSMLLTWQGSIWVCLRPQRIFKVLVPPSSKKMIDTRRALLQTFASNWATRTYRRKKTCRVRSRRTLGTRCQNMKQWNTKSSRWRKKKIGCKRKKKWWTLWSNRFRNREGKRCKRNRKCELWTIR